MKVINDLYDYGLKIVQNTDYFKFSIDSILLAEFAKVKNGQRILDMCTGNAPIPLILYSKNKNIIIDGVEIQKEIYSLAKKTIKINDLEENIKIYNEDIKNYKILDKYDIITCNPPYFKVSNTSYKNTNQIKQIARHEIMITLEEIISNAARFLKENGSFYLVQRTERFLDTIKYLEKYKFGIRKVIFINTKKDSPSEFFLIESSLSKKSDLKILSKDIFNLKSYKNMF